MKFVVARVDDFPPETRRVVRVGGREIGVFRFGEAFYAIRSRFMNSVDRTELPGTEQSVRVGRSVLPRRRD